MTKKVSDQIKQDLKVIEGIQESKEKYRKVIQAGIAKWVKDFQDGRIKIESVEDLKKLIEMDIELQRDDLTLNRIKRNKGN